MSIGPLFAMRTTLFYLDPPSSSSARLWVVWLLNLANQHNVLILYQHATAQALIIQYHRSILEQAILRLSGWSQLDGYLPGERPGRLRAPLLQVSVPGLWSHGPSQLLDWAMGSCASPRVLAPSREAGCAGQLHEISHQPPFNLNHGIPLTHTHTHTHTTLTRAREQVYTSSGEQKRCPRSPQVQTHMTCNAGCHVTYRSSTTLPENRVLRLIAQVSTPKEYARWT